MALVDINGDSVTLLHETCPENLFSHGFFLFIEHTRGHFKYLLCAKNQLIFIYFFNNRYIFLIKNMTYTTFMIKCKNISKYIRFPNTKTYPETIKQT